MERFEAVERMAKALTTGNACHRSAIHHRGPARGGDYRGASQPSDAALARNSRRTPRMVSRRGGGGYRPFTVRRHAAAPRVTVPQQARQAVTRTIGSAHCAPPNVVGNLSCVSRLTALFPRFIAGAGHVDDLQPWPCGLFPTTTPISYHLVLRASAVVSQKKDKWAENWPSKTPCSSNGSLTISGFSHSQ